MKSSQVKKLQDKIRELKDDVLKHENELSDRLKTIAPEYQAGAANLVHYMELRKHNLVPTQKKLGHLGITRFARAQSHIMDSLVHSDRLLSALLKEEIPQEAAALSAKDAEKAMIRNSEALLGKKPADRRVRIMVTLPSEAANNPKITDELAKRGMDCARINCAHDNEAGWTAMIRNVRKAGKKYGREIRIAMDLGGPKIRTGTIQPGPEVRHLTTKKDSFGRVITPAQILFTDKLDSTSPNYAIPIDSKCLDELQSGDRLKFTDTRDREAVIEVAGKTEHGVLAHCYASVYISSETILYPEREDMAPIRISYIPPHEQALRVKPGDILIVHRAKVDGEPAIYDEEGSLLQEAHVSCTLPEVFEAVDKGEKIYFDDGKIGGKVEEVGKGYLKVRIERAKLSGTKLKADKGINLPDIKRPINGLTEKDCKDLEFVVANADIVNVSFVNRSADVQQLIDILGKMGAGKRLGITLKIETQEAFNNLPDILLTAMQVHPVGVMIARGDLAIEVGWDEFGRIQQEILGICTAAHIPVIWATQVLESLAKKGLPSRSEITDATQGLKAECVMLNKGPYTHRAVSLLNKIFSDMEVYQYRNEALFPPLKKA